MEAAHCREPPPEQRQIQASQRGWNSWNTAVLPQQSVLQHLGSVCAAVRAIPHHFVGVVAMVLHAVLEQLLLVQVPGPAVRTHERGAVGDVAEESEDELRSPARGWIEQLDPSKPTQQSFGTAAASPAPSQSSSLLRWILHPTPQPKLGVSQEGTGADPAPGKGTARSCIAGHAGGQPRCSNTWE